MRDYCENIVKYGDDGKKTVRDNFGVFSCGENDGENTVKLL